MSNRSRAEATANARTLLTPWKIVKILFWSIMAAGVFAGLTGLQPTLKLLVFLGFMAQFFFGAILLFLLYAVYTGK